MKKKVVPKFRQEVKVKIDIVTSDDIKIYYTRKFQYFTARYIINYYFYHLLLLVFLLSFPSSSLSWPSPVGVSSISSL